MVTKVLTESKEISAKVSGFKRCICGALHDLVPFVQFKKYEKHSWMSATFSKVEGFQTETCNFTKSNTLPWVFFTFFVQIVPKHATNLIFLLTFVGLELMGIR